MRRFSAILLTFLTVSSAMASGQSHRRSRMSSVLDSIAVEQSAADAARKAAARGGGLMHYIVEEGDTVFIDNIQPVWVFPKGFKIKGTDWRRYYKLVYNFNKVYPYALLGRKLIAEVDANIDSQGMNRLQKDRYINSMQWELLRDFEGAIRHMTISQGKLLVRLVDREIGKSSYEIVKDYKNGLAAGFWQGVARIFGQDLKNHYDPKGEDLMTEYLIQKWESGEFDDLYFSVFMEMPKRTYIPSKYE
ncbi:MAG: DUF4294 domain-containing protein [Bacteroidales bacterium]|nr:DUF4294 domain-containing protein [Bacteroidales bacterium]